MLISEIYHSIQGEGTLTGTASVFVRTSGCNLRCDFCDTPYASWSPEGTSMDLEEIISTVQSIVESRFREEPGSGKTRHIVLTGGEPLLPRDVTDLCARFHQLGFHITIETAGTIFRDLSCDLISISPKFANSTPTLERAGSWHFRHEQTRYRPEIVNQLIRRYPAQLKFVIDQPADIDEVLDYLQSACPDWRERPELASRVMLMPQGIDLVTLQQKETWLRPLCLELGFAFCPRLHIQWFGNKRGT